MEPLMSSVRKSLNKLTALPGAARAVLIEVCELVERGGLGKCFAGNQHLAEAACCHAGSVSRHLSVLQKMGLLDIKLENNDNAKRLLIPSPELVRAYRSEDMESLNTVLRGSSHGVKRGLYTLLSGSSHGANHTHIHKEDTEQLHGELATLRAAVLELEGRLGKATEQYRADQQTITDLKAENKKLTQAARPTEKADTVALASPELAFEHFWNAYDKKMGSKPNAKRQWERLKTDVRRLILNGLAVYKASVSEKQYLPYPETFLNGKLWEAEEYGQQRAVLTTRLTPNEIPSNVPAGSLRGSTIPSMRDMMKPAFSPH